MNRRRAGVVLIVGTILAAGAPAAALLGTAAPIGANAFTAATLQPPSGLQASSSCPGGGYTVSLTWTASPSGFVQGYGVEWASASTGPWTLLTVTSSTTAQQTGVPKKTTRWYRVAATAGAWTSSWVSVSHTTPNANC